MQTPISATMGGADGPRSTFTRRASKPIPTLQVYYKNDPCPHKMRVSYVPDEPRPEKPEEQAVADRMRQRRGGTLLPLDQALLHSPALAEGWNSFFGAVRNKTLLADSIREIAIVRVAALNRAWFQWEAHAPILLQTGILCEKDVQELQDTQRVPAGLDEKHRVVVEYTDAMTREVVVDQGTFDAVKGLFGEREVVEMTATIAAYNCVSRFLVALDVGEMAQKQGVGRKGTT